MRDLLIRIRDDVPRPDGASDRRPEQKRDEVSLQN